jgi:putative transposase
VIFRRVIHIARMAYDPEKHRRRSIRLWDHDYSRAGAYYLTLCTQNRECLFGDVMEGEMRMNEAGRMADDFIARIPDRYPAITVDCYQVMPNHIHMVLIVADVVGPVSVGAIHELPLQRISRSNQVECEKRRLQRRAMLIPKCVGFYRMNTAKRVNQMRGVAGVRVWQRNYHEHIIRHQRSLDRIRRYIADNPKNWDRDRNNPSRQGGP